ncbi:histidine-phosphotransfer domain HPT domain-containing protein [Roridomyces roridus]|uniref:Histidine-phosphotransfer domain HPT domain-containing protein n=1 Tax=Roridomyces roridus TaxID=1738132 RepID=A0AAD7CDH7_9AGAR|nr:histidine-phosphotransfer domain HPT domain-containing protein [Roridomyces roridus]
MASDPSPSKPDPVHDPPEPKAKSDDSPKEEPDAAPEVEPESDAPSEPVNLDIFNQILELDDGDTYDFSKEMVEAYFSQAPTTFESMNEALTEKDHTKLSELGHFLKGSSAALGISKVQSACEKIQHYGELRDEEAKKDITPDDALSRIELLITEANTEYALAEKWLRKYYADRNQAFDEPEP